MDDRQFDTTSILHNLEDRLPEFMSGEGWQTLRRRYRENPLGTLAVAAGVGFLLQRTGLLSTALGAMVSSGGKRRTGARNERHDRLVAWLNDAYAMELAIIPILENHAGDARRFPRVRKRDLKHLKETKQHARLVKECLELLGEKPSAGKKAIGRMTGAINALVTEPFDDEVVRNFLADYATEHLEIASYRAIIVAAEEAGEEEIARICGRILEDEEEMAAWLEENLPVAVSETLEELGVG
jgi:ferritin-like metal-binding protein YciE